MKYFWLIIFCLPMILSAENLHSEFIQLANKKGFIGYENKVSVFQTPEWQTWISDAKKSPQIFEFMLYSTAGYSMTAVNIKSWGNVPAGLLAALAVQEITGKSWLDYDGRNPTVCNQIALAKKAYQPYTFLLQILGNHTARIELHKFFRRQYYGTKPAKVLSQKELTALAEQQLVKIYGSRVLKQRPWKIIQDDFTITLSGTLHQPKQGYRLGGTAFIVLKKDNGQILFYTHGK